MTDGIVVGGAKDEKAIHDALKARSAAQQTVVTAMGTWLSIDARAVASLDTTPSELSQHGSAAAESHQ
ncbi:MAG: hypothetical protein HQ526_09795 [Actinobacteria bacterium]|nr:hypothetical protein [Actinomycetota bacterium]